MTTFKIPSCVLRPNNLYGERQCKENNSAIMIQLHIKVLRIHGKGGTIRRFHNDDDLSSLLKY